MRRERAAARAYGSCGLMADLGLLGMRMVVGGLLAGHGAQKLFGWFKGPGLKGTAGWLESIGLTPGSRWAPMAAMSEFGGGVLTAAGLGGPVGPITLLAPMAMATGKVHWGKPIWATEGGAELPVTNMAVATGLALAGPGRFSFDRVLGLRLHWSLVALMAMATAGGVALGLAARPAQQPGAPAQAAEPEGERASAVAASGDGTTAGDGTAAGGRVTSDGTAAGEPAPTTAL